MCSKQAPVLCLPHSSWYCSLQRLSLHNGPLVLLYGTGVCAAQTYTISTPFREKKPTYQNSSQRLDSKLITVRVAYDLNKSPLYDFPCYQSASDLILRLLVADMVIFAWYCLLITDWTKNLEVDQHFRVYWEVDLYLSINLNKIVSKWSIVAYTELR